MSTPRGLCLRLSFVSPSFLLRLEIPCWTLDIASFDLVCESAILQFILWGQVTSFLIGPEH